MECSLRTFINSGFVSNRLAVARVIWARNASAVEHTARTSEHRTFKCANDSTTDSITEAGSVCASGIINTGKEAPTAAAAAASASLRDLALVAPTTRLRSFERTSVLPPRVSLRLAGDGGITGSFIAVMRAEVRAAASIVGSIDDASGFSPVGMIVTHDELQKNKIKGLCFNVTVQ